MKSAVASSRIERRKQPVEREGRGTLPLDRVNYDTSRASNFCRLLDRFPGVNGPPANLLEMQVP